MCVCVHNMRRHKAIIVKKHNTLPEIYNIIYDDIIRDIGSRHMYNMTRVCNIISPNDNCESRVKGLKYVIYVYIYIYNERASDCCGGSPRRGGGAGQVE